MLPGLTQMGGALFRCTTNSADTINDVGLMTSALMTSALNEVALNEVVVMRWKILK